MKKAAYLAFVLLGVIWGCNFIFMKWASSEIAPGQVVLLRVLFGFLPILFFALATRALRWNHVRYSHHFVVMSLLATAIFYFAFARGVALLTSSIAGVLSGAIPLFTFICAWLFLNEERVNWTRAAGVGLGFLGVLLIARPWSSVGGIDLRGVAYMLAGSLCAGLSFVYARRFITPLKLPSAALATYQMGLALVFLLLGTSLDGIEGIFSNPRAWIGLVFGLGLCGTGLSYVIVYFIVEKLGAVAASGVSYITPAVALLIGVCLVGDSVHPTAYVAMILILSGVAVLQLGGRSAELRRS